MNYVEFEIACGEEWIEIAIARAGEWEAVESIEELSAGIKLYLTETNFRDIGDHLIDWVQDLDWPYYVTTHTPKNWNEEWEKNFSPIEIPGVCLVRATHHSKTSVLPEVIIAPRNAFGTGHHSTTYLMMEAMHKLHLRNKKILDFGTGTGILAIWAVKLGCAWVEAIDIMEEAIENTQDNMELNGIDPERIHVHQGDVTQIEERNFDVILANVNRNVLMADIPALASVLNSGGRMLLSGLLVSDEESIRYVLRDLVWIRTVRKEDWILIEAKKNEAV